MIRAFILALVLLAAACDGAEPSCALDSAEGDALACIEYASVISEADAEASCAGGGGTWRDEPCDATDAVARCDAFGSSTWYYPAYLTDTGATLADLQQTCEETGGEFTALGASSSPAL